MLWESKGNGDDADEECAVMKRLVLQVFEILKSSLESDIVSHSPNPMVNQYYMIFPNHGNHLVMSIGKIFKFDQAGGNAKAFLKYAPLC